MMPDEYLDHLSINDRLPGWQRMLSSEQPSGTIIVVVEDDGVVRGFATCRPTPDEPTSGEVGAIYLDPSCWDHGLGAELMAAVTQRARTFGLRQLTLWVHPQNDRAIAFYKRAGWSDDNQHRREVVWGLEVAEHRYRLVLGEA
jgi:RimJ/RimL family protein N-acetyltransferase